MSEKIEKLSLAIAAASPFIEKIADTFFKPKLVEIKKKLKLNKSEIEYLDNIKFIDYLSAAYEKNSIINTLLHNKQPNLLKEIYLPLTVSNEEGRNYLIDADQSQFISDFKRILIVDDAGMGKSTLLKRMFLSIVENGSGIPVIIELRRLSAANDMMSEIINQISVNNNIPDKEFLYKLFNDGEFYFFLDGLDEIPLDDRSKVVMGIQDFIRNSAENNFIISSRKGLMLSSFGDFYKFEIEPLVKEEAYQLLRNFDNAGEISTLLIKTLNQNEFKSMQEFLVNPLLVTLLFAAFDFKNTIPLKKHIFYRQVYDALFEGHDLSKGGAFIRKKNSNLDIEEFHQIIRHIGFKSLVNGKVEYSKDELIRLIIESKKFNGGVDFKPYDFLTDLLTTVPLFVQDGNYYRWAHKSLQEYFAATFINTDAKNEQLSILNNIYNHLEIEKFINLLDLFYSIDRKTFRQTIVLPLLKNYISYLDNTYTTFKDVNKEERQFLTFTGNHHIYRTSYFHDETSSNRQLSIIIDIRSEMIHSFITKYDYFEVYSRLTNEGKLINLLSNKNEDFLVKLNQRNFFFNNKELDKIEITPEKLHEVNESSSSELNTEINFNLINIMIIYGTGILKSTIDREKALITINELLQEKKITEESKLSVF